MAAGNEVCCERICGAPAGTPAELPFFHAGKFFSLVDLKPESINILDGMAAGSGAECAACGEKIRTAGGIGLFPGGMVRSFKATEGSA